MQGVWVSVKENINCMHNMNDVFCHSKQLTKHDSSNCYSKLPADIVCRERLTPPSIFTEIEDDDLSRKVIEKILANALTSSTRKIGKVFKMKNLPETLSTFEEFRETVKKKAITRKEAHTRSLVDGNELLCFYVISMTCFNRESKNIAVPCECSDCTFFRIIESKFDRKYTETEKSGMELSLNSAALRESIDICKKKRKNTKLVVIICRIIAGRIKKMNGRISEDEYEYDSVLKKGFSQNSQHLIVYNSNAVLPCFAVILN